MNTRVVFNADGETATRAVVAALARQGLQVVRSFDLRSALAAHDGCECPHHGTAECSCQFVVLLVYGEAGEPVILTTHSRDGQTDAQIVHDTTTASGPHPAEEVTTAMMEAAMTLQTAVTPTQDVAAHAE